MTISKDNTVILDGSGEKKAIEERCDQVSFLSVVSFDKIKQDKNWYTLHALNYN